MYPKSFAAALLVALAATILGVFLHFAQAPAAHAAPLPIIGGQAADPDEYPWMVYVDADGFQCGGSLIAPEWVLTAAHCLLVDETRAGRYLEPAQVFIRLGVHRIGWLQFGAQKRRVVEIVPYPAYDLFDDDGDIALLKLDRPARLGKHAQPIRLVSSPADDPLVAPGTMATATGWGAKIDSEDSWSDVLLELSIPIISNPACNRAMPGPAITANQLCAGNPAGGQDTCYGDSGGPLLVADGAGGWKLAGITSSGSEEGCALRNRYGIYTRVSRFSGWINRHVNPPVAGGTVLPHGRPDTARR